MTPEKKVYVIQCGFTKQLSLYVGNSFDGDELYLARFNFSAPEAIIQTHLDLLKGKKETF